MRARLALAGALLIVLAACGGGSGDDGGDAVAGSGDEGDAAATEKAAGDADAVTRDELPPFLADLERVCTTQLGFLGLTPYDASKGMVHPVVLFEDYRGEGFIDSSRTLPAGWEVAQDEDYEDSTDLKPIELVACSDRVAEDPTGIMCTFKGDDGEPDTKLELVDATFELKVYAATTGELKHEATLEAKEDECPFIATFEKGDKTFVAEPSDDDYVAALKPVVTP